MLNWNPPAALCCMAYGIFLLRSRKDNYCIWLIMELLRVFSFWDPHKLVEDWSCYGCHIPKTTTATATSRQSNITVISSAKRPNDLPGFCCCVWGCGKVSCSG